ncbi:MAG: hypothetical protein K9J06_09900 [Flavobacteriales bacterium]|nr:hypothetical protein [Flavobacteriales bacterium]
MAKKREDTWTIHHNPPFEVMDITAVNDPDSPWLIERQSWWVKVKTPEYEVTVRAGLFQVWDLISERHRKVNTYLRKLNKSLPFIEGQDRGELLYGHLVDEGFDFAPFIAEYVKYRIDLNKRHERYMEIEERHDPEKGYAVMFRDNREFVDPVLGHIPAADAKDCFLSGVLAGAVENAKICYPDIFNSHPMYMLEFERLIVDSASGLQHHLASLQRSAARSKQVLKL